MLTVTSMWLSLPYVARGSDGRSVLRIGQVGFPNSAYLPLTSSES